jgi:hypothetical protein
MVMVAPTPAPFGAFGPVWYGEPLCGLCRALAAPWLDPWWLARETRTGHLRSSQATVLASRLQPSSGPATEPPVYVAANQATISSLDRARARAAASRAAAGSAPRR